MGRGIRIIAAAARAWAERFDKMLVANLIAALIGLPFLALGAFAAYSTGQVSIGAVVTAIIVGVLPNPAMAGLQLMTREMAAGELLLMPGPFEGLRLYWKQATRAWLVSLLITIVLVFNAFFYADLGLPFAPIAELATIYVLLAWFAAHVYVYPLILEQEDRRLRTLYRNAFVMAMSHPLVTLQVLFVWAILLVASAASGIIVAVGLSLAAALQQQAAFALLPTFRREPVAGSPDTGTAVGGDS